MTPIFKGDRLVALFGNCCHALDIGGRGLSADLREVFEEGLFIPVLKLYDAGAPVEPVFEFLRANVRTPEEVLGDVHSQVVGNEVGGRQLLSFLDEFGLADIEALSGRDRRAHRARDARAHRRAARRRLPLRLRDRRLRRAGAHRGDGAGARRRAHRRLRRLLAAVGHGINVALNYTAGYTTYGVKCAISPDVPNNEGSFRPVTVTAPEGCILNAPYPCAIGGRHLVGHFLPSAVFGALADALPERVIAPGADALWDTQIFGEDPKTGRRFTYVWFSAGGTGRSRPRTAFPATAFPSGIAGVPAEVIEALSPVVVKRRELRPDSGGAGEFRGGLGQTLELAVQGERPFMFSGLYERIDHPAPGLHGGEPGGAGTLTTNRPEIELRAKARVPLPAGTEITLGLPGGGGYGPPWRPRSRPRARGRPRRLRLARARPQRLRRRDRRSIPDGRAGSVGGCSKWGYGRARCRVSITRCTMRTSCNARSASPPGRRASGTASPGGTDRVVLEGSDRTSRGERRLGSAGPRALRRAPTEGIAERRADGSLSHRPIVAVDLVTRLEGRVRQRHALQTRKALDPALEPVSDRARSAGDEDARPNVTGHRDREDQAAEHGAGAAPAPAAALTEPGFRHDELGRAVMALEHVVDGAAVVPRQQPEALQLLERNVGRAAGAVAQIAGGLADRGHHQVTQPVPEAPLLGAEHVQGEHQHPHCRQDGPARVDRHSRATRIEMARANASAVMMNQARPLARVPLPARGPAARSRAGTGAGAQGRVSRLATDEEGRPRRSWVWESACAQARTASLPAGLL